MFACMCICVPYAYRVLAEDREGHLIDQKGLQVDTSGLGLRKHTGEQLRPHVVVSRLWWFAAAESPDSPGLRTRLPAFSRWGCLSVLPILTRTN